MFETHCHVCTTLYRALEMVRASVDNVYLLTELKDHLTVRADLQGISRFIDTTLAEIPKEPPHDGGTKRWGEFADGSEASLGQEAFFDWNGKMRSGQVVAFVDAGTFYIATSVCHPTEDGARQAADYRPAKTKVKSRKR